MKNLSVIYPVFLIIIVTFNNLKAQQAKPDNTPVNLSSFSLCFGASIPNGDYSNKDINAQKAGFAETGFNWNINVNAVFKNSNAGIALMYTSFTNKVNSVVLKSEYEKEFPGTSWTVEATKWKTTAFLGGFCVAYPAGKLTVGGRGMIGFAACKSPVLDAQVTQNGTLIKIHQDMDSKTVFGWDAGLNFCYHITDIMGLNLNADYFSASPQFELIELASINAIRKLASQPINAVNATAGIALMF